jgi:opacity protein-like surface antigen
MRYPGIAKCIIAAAAALPLSVLAQAYVGAGVGGSDNKDFCGLFISANCDKTGTAWRAFAGYMVTPNLGAEAGGGSLGRFTSGDPGSQSKIEPSLADLQVVLKYPAGRASIFARLGAYYARTELNVESAGMTTMTAKKSNGGLAYGLGAQYDFGEKRNIGLRGDFQGYQKVGGTDVGGTMNINTFLVSVVWTLR